MSTNKQVTVTARSKAKPGREKDLENALRAVTGPTHAEEGCLRYAVHRATDDPGSFLIVERWTSMEALNAHLKSPHVQELFAKAPELVVAPAEILTFESVPMGQPAKGLL